MVKGPSLQLLLTLKGGAQRYAYGIIALWKHAELGTSTHCTAAMAAMQFCKLSSFKKTLGSGRCKLWLHRRRHNYASRVTIKHFMTRCLLSSFQGNSLQVQSMMVNDINSDKVGPGIQLEERVSAYSMFITLMDGIDGPSCGINHPAAGDGKKKGGGAKFKCKCNNCGKPRPGHEYKDCTKQTVQNPVSNMAQKSQADKNNWCPYRIRGPHKEED